MFLIVRFYFSPFGPGSPYHRFHNHDVAYYSRLADACDTMLQQRTNYTQHTKPATGGSEDGPFIWLDANNVVWNDIRLGPDDPKLPEAVRALHPDEVLIQPDRVFIGFGIGRMGWAVIWEQDEVNTKRWTLFSNAEGAVKTVYTK